MENNIEKQPKANEDAESKIERIPEISQEKESKTDILRSIAKSTVSISEKLGTGAKTMSTLAHYNFDFFLYISSYFLTWLAAKNFYVMQDKEMCYYLLGAAVLCSIGQNKIASGPVMDWLKKTIDKQVKDFLTRIERK